jgi:hypothetical protein
VHRQRAIGLTQHPSYNTSFSACIIIATDDRGVSVCLNSIEGITARHHSQWPGCSPRRPASQLAPAPAACSKESGTRQHHTAQPPPRLLMSPHWQHLARQRALQSSGGGEHGCRIDVAARTRWRVAFCSSSRASPSSPSGCCGSSGSGSRTPSSLSLSLIGRPHSRSSREQGWSCFQLRVVILFGSDIARRAAAERLHHGAGRGGVRRRVISEVCQRRRRRCERVPCRSAPSAVPAIRLLFRAVSRAPMTDPRRVVSGPRAPLLFQARRFCSWRLRSRHRRRRSGKSAKVCRRVRRRSLLARRAARPPHCTQAMHVCMVRDWQVCLGRSPCPCRRGAWWCCQPSRRSSAS